MRLLATALSLPSGGTMVPIDSWKNQLGELQSSVDYELIPEWFCNFAI